MITKPMNAKEFMAANETDRRGPKPAPCDCSIALTEGELTDLQGIESWLSASDDVCPPDPLGRGVRMRWLKTLASILDQSNAQAQPPKVG